MVTFARKPQTFQTQSEKQRHIANKLETNFDTKNNGKCSEIMQNNANPSKRRRLPEEINGPEALAKLELLVNIAKEKRLKAKKAVRALKQQKSTMTTAQEQCALEILEEQEMDLYRKFMEKNNFGKEKMDELAKKIEKEKEKEEREAISNMETEEPSTSGNNAAPTPPAPRTRGEKSKEGGGWLIARSNTKPKYRTIPTEQAPEKEQKKTKAQRPPPITTGRINPVEFNKALGDTTVNYKLKPGNRTQVICNTVEDHGKVMEILKTENPGGHSYTPKSLRKTVLVMKDIHQAVTVEEIKKELKEQTGLEVGVKRLTTPRSRNNNYELDIVLVTTDAENANTLRKVFSINYQIIRWENLKKKELIQCYNCQQFGHIANYCMNRYACVKCNKEHGPKECQRTKESEDQPFCTNCGELGHPASFGGCKVAIELREKVKENREKKKKSHEEMLWKRQMINNSVNNMVRPGLLYSQAAGGAPAQNPSPNPPMNTAHKDGNLRFLGDECKRLFNTDLFSLLEKAREFVPWYKQLKSIDAQREAYLNFVFSL